MSIMWIYLDKEKATMRVLEDYESMKFTYEHSPDRISEEQSSLIGLGSPRMDGMPHAHNPQAGENHLVESLDRIDTMKERYRQAVEFLNWFEPCWAQLSESEQYILDSFFISKEPNAVYRCGEHFGIERNSVYKKRKLALEHLSLLLYGKE